MTPLIIFLEHNGRSRTPPGIFLGQLSLKQWMTALRSYWQVESTHNILDTTFEEDKCPIIAANAKAAYCVLPLRRIAYNIVASYRNITQHSETKRKTPYRVLLRDLEISALQALDWIWMVDGLHCRSESSANEAKKRASFLGRHRRDADAHTASDKTSLRKTFAQAQVRLARPRPDQKQMVGSILQVCARAGRLSL